MAVTKTDAGGETVAESQAGREETAAVPESNSAAVVKDYLLFLQAKRDRDIPSAIKYLKKTTQKDKENETLESELFSLLTSEGLLEEAFPLAQKERARFPSSLLATLVLTANHAWQGEWQKAADVLDSFSDSEAKAFLVPLLKAWLYVGMNQPEKAKESLSALNVTGTEALYHFHLALMNDIWDNAEESEKNYKALMDKNNGFSLRAAQTYGNFLLRRGNYERFNVLLEAYRKGSRSFPLMDEAFFLAGASEIGKNVPASVPTAKEGLAEAFFDVAGSLSEKNNFESAYFFTQIALFLDKNLALARVLKGSLLEQMERADEASALYAAEKPDSETYFSAQISLGRLLVKKESFDKAEKVLKRLTEKRTDSYLPYIEMGDMYMQAKKYARAIDAYTQALEKVYRPQKSNWILYYSRGTAYERNNQWDLAEKDFLKALLLNPDQPLTLNYLGYSWLERGKNISQAKEMLERAVLKSPQDGFIADSLGWAYYLTKEYKKSVAVLELAVMLDPGSAVINDHLGDAYWRVGRKREARFQWLKSLELNDDFSGNDRERVRMKIEKGLDAVGDKDTSLQNEKAAVVQKTKKKNDSKNRAGEN